MVSSAVLTSMYSSAGRWPERRSLSRVKSSSRKTVIRVGLVVDDGAVEVGSGAGFCGVPATGTASLGRLRRNPAAAARRRPMPAMIHHLYLESGSGVSIGLPRPPPGRLSLAASPPASGPPDPAAAPCGSPVAGPLG